MDCGDNTNHEHELDLALAAELQSALLRLSDGMDVPNHTVAAKNRMCGRIGGDLFDILRLNEDQTALIIGDVVGHGIRASLLMAQIMGHIRSDLRRAARPVAIISALNNLLLDLGNRTGTVLPCSIFYAVIDCPSGVCFYVNAGHPHPLLSDRHSGAVTPLGSHDILLGIEEFTASEMCHTFAPGQRLVMYTDGIVDALDANGEHFSQHRLADLATEYIAARPDELVGAILSAVDDFRGDARQSDDETVIIVDRN